MSQRPLFTTSEQPESARRRGILASSWPPLLLLGAVYLALALFFNSTYPVWEGGDEPQHFEQARVLARQGTIPRPVNWTTTPIPERNMSHHPPLYYAAQALSVGWLMPAGEGRLWRANPFVTWPDHPAHYALAVHTPDEQPPYGRAALAVHAARFVSSLLGLLLVLAAYLTAREVVGPRGGLVAAGVVAFTPAVVALSSTVGNEVAVGAFGGLTVAAVTRLARRGGTALTAGLVVGGLGAAAVLSKLNGLAVAPVVVLGGLLAPRLALSARDTHPWRGRVAYLVLALGLPAFALGAWGWAFREDLGLIIYNSELGSGAAGSSLGWIFTPFNPAAWERLLWALPRLFASYWGTLGAVSGAYYLPPVFYLGVGVAALAGLAGMAAGLWIRRGRLALDPGQRRALLVVAAMSLLLTYVVIARTAQARTAAAHDGRHLLTIAGAWATLLVLGWAWLLPRRAQVVAAVGALLALAAASVLGPAQYAGAVHLPFAPIVPATAGAPAQMAYANGLVLEEAAFPMPDLHQAATLKATLRWRVERRLDDDFEAALVFVASDGRPYLLHQTMPLREVLPPSGWLAGDVVSEVREVNVPRQLPLGRGKLELHVVGARDGLLLPARDGAAVPLALGQAVVRPQPISEVEIAHRLDARFGAGLDLVGLALDEALARPGGGLPVKLFWRPSATLVDDYVLSLQLLDAKGGVAAQVDAQPFAGQYPTSQWRPGELVAEARVLPLPANLAPGAYDLLVIVYKQQTLERLRVKDAAGERDFAPVARVEVRR